MNILDPSRLSVDEFDELVLIRVPPLGTPVKTWARRFTLAEGADWLPGVYVSCGYSNDRGQLVTFRTGVKKGDIGFSDIREAYAPDGLPTVVWDKWKVASNNSYNKCEFYHNAYLKNAPLKGSVVRVFDRPDYNKSDESKIRYSAGSLANDGFSILAFEDYDFSNPPSIDKAQIYYYWE